MIVAVARNGAIGLNGGMPWHVPEDAKHFKAVTEGYPVIMGRKTWESLPVRPLPSRLNIVVSRQQDYVANGATLIHDYSELQPQIQAMAPDIQTAFIIGGTTIYQKFYNQCRYIWITRLDINPIGDTYFPLPEDRGFIMVMQTEPATSKSDISYVFEKWLNPEFEGPRSLSAAKN